MARDISIEGVGFLWFPRGCKIRHGEEILKTHRTKFEGNYSLILPNINLELTRITTALSDQSSREVFREIARNTPSESLKLILGQYKVLMAHRKNIDQVYYYMKIMGVVMGIVALIGIGVLGILTILTYVVHDNPNEIELELVTRREDGAVVAAEAPGRALVRFR